MSENGHTFVNVIQPAPIRNMNFKLSIKKINHRNRNIANMFKGLEMFISLSCFLLLHFTGFAADRYWVGGASANWGSTSSWSTTLGGSSGSSVPSSSDIVYLDGSDISTTAGLQTGAVTINFQTTNRTAGRLNVQNAGDFTFIDGTGTRLLTVGNLTGTDLTINSGCFLRVGGTSNAGLSLSANSVVASISGTLDISNSSSTYNMNSASVTIHNGGKLKYTGTLSNTSKLVVENGGTVEVARTTATIPLALSWGISSNLVVVGYTSSSTGPTNFTQQFGNVEWNCTSQTSSVPLNVAVSIHGNFTITSTGSGQVRLTATSTARNMIVRGNLTLTAGTINLAASSGNGTINLRGNLIMNGGTLTESSTSTASGITFDSTVTQTFTKTSGTISNTLFFTVASGATVDFQNILDGSSGAFTNSGTMIINHDQGITASGSTGQIQVSGARTYNTTGNYTYSGTSAQVLGAALPASVNNLSINNGNTNLTMGGSLTINGSLALTSGCLSIGENTLTLNGDFSGSATNNLIGGPTSNISIGGSGPMSTSLFLKQTGDTTVKNLTLNRSNETITLGNTFKLVGTFTPTAGTLATGGNLTLISNSVTTASVAAGNGTITGNVNVQRFIPGVARRWRFLSSSVTGATLANWKNQIHITGSGGASNGFDAAQSNSASVFTYNEAVITGDLNSGWTAATNINTALTAGKGYRVFVRGTRQPGRLNGTLNTQDSVTLEVSGTVNSGNINMNPTFTSSGNSANDGWNFLGNPYPSAIDWNAFHDAGRNGTTPDFSGTDYAHLDAVIYVYNATNNSYQSYNPISNAGTLSNGIIPSGAAFWVKASAANPTMTLKESYKTSTAPGNVFKSDYQDRDFRIRMTMDSINQDEMVVKYIDEAAATKDVYDIAKMWGAEVNIATLSKEGSYLALNSKPFHGDGDTVRLSVYAKSTGSYTMSFVNASDFAENLPLYLLDYLTGNIIDMRTDTAYTFAINMSDASSYGDNRFEMIVGKMPVVIIPTAVTETASTSDNISLYPYAAQQNITISGLKKEVNNIEIRDLNGRLLMETTQTTNANNQVELNISQLPAAMYFLWIQQGQGGKPELLRFVKE
ncbi:MAG: T9SS type A sorting domain-containing protein [Bacteroidia bacterium]